MKRSKATNLIVHLAAWMLFMVFPLLFMNGPRDDTSITSILVSGYYWQFILCYVCIFYLHTYYIFPQIFLKKKYWLYGLIGAIGFAAIFIIRPFDSLAIDYFQYKNAPSTQTPEACLYILNTNWLKSIWPK